MSKYLYRCLENYDSVELEDVIFDAREEGDELDKSKNAITLSPQRRPKELVSTKHMSALFSAFIGHVLPTLQCQSNKEC